MNYYKYDEIKSHFEDFLNNNLDYLKENETDYLDDLHHMAFNEVYYIISTA